MASIVTLQIYSGRPNPSWQLDEHKEAELEERLRSATRLTSNRPSGASEASATAATIARAAERAGAAAPLHIQEGIVDQGSAGANVVDDSEIEAWLVDTAGTAISDELRQAVAQSRAARASFIAEGTAAGREGVKCAKCQAADAPAYNPAPWNTPGVQPNNNCYNYANNQMTNTFAQPGRATGHQATVMDCKQVTPAATSDGLKAVNNFHASLAAGKGWYVALVVWPKQDYHWYRQDKSGCWSHKPGQTQVRDVDNGGQKIADPQTCNRGPYTDFCTYMVTNKGVTIR